MICVPCEGCSRLSSPRSVTVMTQNPMTHSRGAEWNLLSHQAGLGLATDQADHIPCFVLVCFFVLFICLLRLALAILNLLCRPFTQRFSCLCLCLLSARMKGKSHCAQLTLFLKACLVGKQLWWAVSACRT